VEQAGGIPARACFYSWESWARFVIRMPIVRRDAGSTPLIPPIFSGTLRRQGRLRAHLLCADEAFMLSISYNPLCVQSAHFLAPKSRSFDPYTCTICSGISDETTREVSCS
jgi:hypothetical protein